KTADIHLETGEELNLTCSARSAIPAANITLLMDGEPLQPHSGDSWSVGVVGLLWDQPGKHTLNCTVTVGPEKRSKELVVHVYGECGTTAVGDTSPCKPHWSQCKPFGPIVNPTLPIAPPHMDDQLCPPTHTWTEGQEVNQWCRARGKPNPVVTCHKDGTIILMQQPCIVSRNHSGTYWCNASNALGTTGRSITVRVEYWDINVGLLVALAVLAAVLVAGGAVVYRLYYRKKKIRQYKLQKEQQRLLALGDFSNGAAAAPNGSGPGAQP
uniref:Ig-like domain-containing protein n=1 Tax=Pavo cristatus TaxID=9049 RepID=A0A8C9LE16_PAVCR